MFIVSLSYYLIYIYNNFKKNIINSNIKFKSIFNYPLRKYKINILLEYVIKILYSSLSFVK